MRLAEALRELVAALDRAKVEYALVGGLAASARGEARFTRDIDVAVATPTDEHAERLVWELQGRGYSVLATVEQDATHRLATVRLSDSAATVCDLVFATCGIEAEVVETAEQLEVFPGTTVDTASVEALLAMKVLSATKKRPRDLGDIRAMIIANPQFSESTVARYLDLIEVRGYARGQALADKWSRLRDELGV